MNVLDYALIALIAAAVTAVLVMLYKRKKKAGSYFSCSGDCTHCNGCRK